jgi:Secretion system C-terminal sorting domain
MKRCYLILLFFISLVKLQAQDVRFYHEVEAGTGTATVRIFGYSIGPLNGFGGVNFEFHYNNTLSTLSSIDASPITAGLGWGVANQTFGLNNPGSSIPGQNAFMSYNNFASDFLDDPMGLTPGQLLLTLNFINVMPTAEGFLMSTAENGALTYFSFNAGLDFPLQVAGAPQLQALPLELLSFDAKATDKTINVAWSTANEIDFSHFDLERSLDGRNFLKIAKVTGKGEQALNEYEFTDEKVQPSLTYYYRLKMNDNDGRIEYSQVVQASIEGDAPVVVSVSPNPTSRLINVQFATSNAADYVVKLFDENGRLLSVSDVSAPKGVQTATIDMSLYEAGIYHLTVQGEHYFTSKKIVKN